MSSISMVDYGHLMVDVIYFGCIFMVNQWRVWSSLGSFYDSSEPALVQNFQLHLALAWVLLTVHCLHCLFDSYKYIYKLG